MIDTQADARRLSSIDAATSLGRLADAVVVAVSRGLEGRALTTEDRKALQAASEWLGRLGARLEKPLDVSRIGEMSSGPGQYGFGPDLAAVAVGALGTKAGSESDVDALDRLGKMADAVANGTSSQQAMEALLQVFESIALAMLSAADALLTSPTSSTWPTTFAS